MGMENTDLVNQMSFSIEASSAQYLNTSKKRFQSHLWLIIVKIFLPGRDSEQLVSTFYVSIQPKSPFCYDVVGQLVVTFNMEW